MLTRTLRTIRLGTIDRRSQAGVFLRRLREDLTAQLGGNLSPAQELLVEEIAKKALITRAVGEWLLRQETLVHDGRDGPALLPIVLQHDALQGSLTKMLTTLGLERRAKPVPSLAEYIAKKDAAAKKDIISVSIFGEPSFFDSSQAFFLLLLGGNAEEGRSPGVQGGDG